MNPATRLLAVLGAALRKPLLRRRLGRVVLERVRGVPLVVLPEVFNPVVFRTGRFLAESVADQLAPTSPIGTDGPLPEALDMGTGSGVCALFAARAGYRVTAVDLNPQAVRCARINALLNGVEERIEVLQGDLFSPVEGRRFDLVLFNPPFFRGAPKHSLDAAWRSTDVLERFAAGLPHVLRPRGRALVVLSTHGDCESLLAALAAGGMPASVAASRDFGGEILRVHSISPDCETSMAKELETAAPNIQEVAF